MKIEKALSKATEKYSKATVLRAAIQVVPYVGGALDTLFSNCGSKIQQDRIKGFLDDLNLRLSKLENRKELEVSEEFYDLALSVFEGVVKTRSQEKRSHFASIIANKIATDLPWEEAEVATRLLNSLDEIHIKLLLKAVKAPVCESPFDDLHVVTLSEHPFGKREKGRPLILRTEFSGYSIDALRMLCSELVSKGLLYDEGVGRVDVKAMEYFVATGLAKWFLSWITDKNA